MEEEGVVEEEVGKEGEEVVRVGAAPGAPALMSVSGAAPGAPASINAGAGSGAAQGVGEGAPAAVNAGVEGVWEVEVFVILLGSANISIRL